ncbi:hypothetical protein ACTWPB_01010 [Nocardia sp. IBHARD005]|uniref:hypothetical protein n=1 Tax=Nocardia sp. IBHARD005 TaxID=3457765 RepID=UPI00405929AF
MVAQRAGHSGSRVAGATPNPVKNAVARITPGGAGRVPGQIQGAVQAGRDAYRAAKVADQLAGPRAKIYSNGLAAKDARSRVRSGEGGRIAAARDYASARTAQFGGAVDLARAAKDSRKGIPAAVRTADRAERAYSGVVRPAVTRISTKAQGPARTVTRAASGTAARLGGAVSSVTRRGSNSTNGAVAAPKGSKVQRGNPRLNQAATSKPVTTGLKYLGRAGVAGTLVAGGYELSRGAPVPETVGKTGGALAGGLAGAKIGAAVGSLGGPAGAVVGGVAGAVVGGVVGSKAGAKIGGAIRRAFD